jgi:hypothetical protein
MLTEDDAQFFLPATHLGETYRGQPDWAAAVAELRPLLDTVGVVVSSSDLKALYFAGRLDYEMYRSAVRVRGKEVEFARSRKHLRPILSTPGSVEHVMRCSRSGLVIVEEHVWRWRYGVPPETVDFIESHMQRREVPHGSGILAFTWSTPADSLSTDCPPEPDEL